MDVTKFNLKNETRRRAKAGASMLRDIRRKTHSFLKNLPLTSGFTTPIYAGNKESTRLAQAGMQKVFENTGMGFRGPFPGFVNSARFNAISGLMTKRERDRFTVLSQRIGKNPKKSKKALNEASTLLKKYEIKKGRKALLKDYAAAAYQKVPTSALVAGGVGAVTGYYATKYVLNAYDNRRTENRVSGRFGTDTGNMLGNASIQGMKFRTIRNPKRF